jgi:Fe-S cluster assembly protein SufD
MTRTGVDVYLAEFERFEEERRGDPGWLRETRRRAIARFADLGFPTTRNEEWRFTSVAPIAEAFFTRPDAGPVTAADLEPFVFGQATRAIRLVFVNGRFAPGWSTSSLRSGLSAGSLARRLEQDPGGLEARLARHALWHDHAFRALNTAFLEDGAVIEIAPGAVLEDPIEILYLSTTGGLAVVSHPRTLVVAGENSQVRLVERYAGADEGPYFTNAVTEIIAGPHAVVDHYRVQQESRRAFHVSTTQVHLLRETAFSSHSIGLGGRLVRNDVNAVLAAEGSDCTLNGLYVAEGSGLVDNHTTIDHASAHCSSHELYKGILGGRARAVFNGKILVRPDAQKTDAKQTNKTLLLSDEAQINTKPQLEIFANDVKCTHGATVGQLDQDALFYLRTRGIGLADARSLLIRAFASDLVNRVRIEALGEQLEAWLAAGLPGVVAGS